MECKVSDFKFASIFLKKICQKNGVPFVNAPVFFNMQTKDNGIFINNSQNIAHTIFQIICEYIRKSDSIIGKKLKLENEDNMFIVLANSLRSFIYNDKYRHVSQSESHILRLYQKPVVWILMKDIVCPIFNKSILNCKIVSVESPYVDISKLITQAEWDNEIDESFIFLNNIDNRIIQSAFLFIDVISLHGLSPIDVLKEIYESDLYEKFAGLLDLSLDEEERKDFESTLIFATGVDFYSYLPKYDSFNKIAQMANNQWQNLSGLEQMIEPYRREDWSVYNDLNPYIKDLWNKVEEVRKKRIQNGHDSGVPFDLLLRIKSKQTVNCDVDTTKTIQEILSSNRVW